MEGTATANPALMQDREVSAHFQRGMPARCQHSHPHILRLEPGISSVKMGKLVWELQSREVSAWLWAHLKVSLIPGLPIVFISLLWLPKRNLHAQPGCVILMFWDSPKERFCIFETTLFVKDNWIRDVQVCWGLGLIFFFLFVTTVLSWKNVILMKQKLLRKSYWFWQFCLEGSWGGIPWKCWSSQLWHSLNGKEFWFISLSLFKMMFQNVLFHGEKKGLIWMKHLKKKEIKYFDWSEAVLQHFILQFCWLFGQHRMI